LGFRFGIIVLRLKSAPIAPTNRSNNHTR
jgi:hypothetical protein